MQTIHDTLILEPEDLKDDAETINLYSFNIPIETVNKMGNILFVNYGEVVFLKVKNLKKFKKENKMLFN